MSSARSIAGGFALATAMFASGGAEAALTIGGGATQYVICAAHVCRAIRPTAVLNATQLATMLAVSDVAVVSGSRAQDIVVHTAFSWTSTHRLTLDSYRSITVGFAVSVTGAGGVTLTTNDGGSGGTFSTQFPGRIDFWDLSSSLVINGVSYTLVGDIATLAADIAANPSGQYALAKNYDASIDGVYTASPILTDFTGAFEGLGHTIEHLTVRVSSSSSGVFTGLFSEVDSGGVVENIGVTEVSILVAHGNVIGGLVAKNLGSIANSFVKGRVNGGEDSQIGGLVGGNQGNIVSSYTTGEVVAGAYTELGGLVGTSTGSIQSSHSTADVHGTLNAKAGGLVGILLGSLKDSWATGSVLIGNYVAVDWPGAPAGGLVGFYFPADSYNPTITNCYSTGRVKGSKGTSVGGLIGIMDVEASSPMQITDSYSTGEPTGLMVGGVVGSIPEGYYIRSGIITDTYWDTDTTGVTNPSQGVGGDPNALGVTGLSDAQLTSGLPAGFDPTVWAENPSINGGRPYLIANPPAP